MPTFDQGCSHLRAIANAKSPKRHECEECAKTGDEWVHLGICRECGATHCRDNSINRHATRHAQASGHPVIASAEPGERWLYCYCGCFVRRVLKNLSAGMHR